MSQGAVLQTEARTRTGDDGATAARTSQVVQGEPLQANIIGASGYTGGELIRLLIQHPDFHVQGATSARYAGQPLHRAHPNLRGQAQIRFQDRGRLPAADVAFCCVPHGRAMELVPQLMETHRLVVDLSADFRLQSPEAYQQWYGETHTAPDHLREAVYGLPETRRRSLPGARLVSGVGCVATATNLALLPLARAGLLQHAEVVVQAQIGSSAAGIEASPAGMHAERSRSMRLYAPTGHRHAAEVEQETGASVHMSVQATELVRGILSTAHVLLPETPSERELWRIWRDCYNEEPFVHIVKERRGIHRGPDPQLVAASNYGHVGFHAEGNRIVATAAIDNLVKGAAGSAIQAANIALGLPETTGLTQLPAHPV